MDTLKLSTVREVLIDHLFFPILAFVAVIGICALVRVLGWMP